VTFLSSSGLAFLRNAFMKLGIHSRRELQRAGGLQIEVLRRRERDPGS
jgi:hypothetical protein